MTEDGVAVAGILVAGASLLAVNVTGNAIYDPIGSIFVGNLLGMVSESFTSLDFYFERSCRESESAPNTRTDQRQFLALPTHYQPLFQASQDYFFAHLITFVFGISKSEPVIAHTGIYICNNKEAQKLEL